VRRGSSCGDRHLQRTGSEFLKGDDYNHDGMRCCMPDSFPTRQLCRRQERLPQRLVLHARPAFRGSNAKAGIFGSGGGNGRATPWSIAFELPSAPARQGDTPRGDRRRRRRQIDVAMNGQPAGKIDGWPTRPSPTTASWGFGASMRFHRHLPDEGRTQRPEAHHARRPREPRRQFTTTCGWSLTNRYRELLCMWTDDRLSSSVGEGLRPAKLHEKLRRLGALPSLSTVRAPIGAANVRERLSGAYVGCFFHPVVAIPAGLRQRCDPQPSPPRCCRSPPVGWIPATVPLPVGTRQAVKS